MFSGFGFRVESSRFRVQGSGFKVQGPEIGDGVYQATMLTQKKTAKHTPGKRVPVSSAVRYGFSSLKNFASRAEVYPATNFSHFWHATYAH